jgi:hypothetical protein
VGWRQGCRLRHHGMGRLVQQRTTPLCLRLYPPKEFEENHYTQLKFRRPGSITVFGKQGPPNFPGAVQSHRTRRITFGPVRCSGSRVSINHICPECNSRTTSALLMRRVAAAGSRLTAADRCRCYSKNGTGNHLRMLLARANVLNRMRLGRMLLHLFATAPQVLARPAGMPRGEPPLRGDRRERPYRPPRPPGKPRCARGRRGDRGSASVHAGAGLSGVGDGAFVAGMDRPGGAGRERIPDHKNHRRGAPGSCLMPGLAGAAAASGAAEEPGLDREDLAAGGYLALGGPTR